MAAWHAAGQLMKMNTIISISPHAKQVLDKALAFLGVDGVTVIISVNTRMLDRLAGEDMELTAATFPAVIEKAYNLYLRSADVPDVVICHEAVHISQYADGRLKMDERGKVYWNGEEYGKEADYYSRPWEREAFSNEYKILRKIKNK